MNYCNDYFFIWQSKAKAEKNQLLGQWENVNSCQLCKVEKLFFEPPPKFCSPCGARIKKNAPYYSGTITESGPYYFCLPCYNESRSDSVLVDSIQFLKSKLEKKRNNDEFEEAVSISVSLFPGFILIVMHLFSAH